MFALNVCFGPTNTMIAFLFNDQVRAEEMLAKAGEDIGDDLIVSDDFGQQGRFVRKTINAIFFEDMEKSKHAHIARGIHQLLMQIEGNEAGEANEKIKANARKQRHAAIMGGGNSGLPVAGPWPRN